MYFAGLFLNLEGLGGHFGPGRGLLQRLGRITQSGGEELLRHLVPAVVESKGILTAGSWANQYSESTMKLRIVLEPSEDGGYTAVVPALPGCLSEGDTRDEVLANVQEAIALYLEPVEDDWDFAPDAEVLEVAV